MDDIEQPIISPKKPVKTVENEEKHTAEKTIREGLCLEASCTNEDLEKISDMLKTIASKNKICKQLFKIEKPRTKLRKKMQIEKEAAHEGAMNVVVIDDAGSEETVHTIGDQYCVDNEKFIDIQGVAGTIPEDFCTDKQDNPDVGSASKSL